MERTAAPRTRRLQGRHLWVGVVSTLFAGAWVTTAIGGPHAEAQGDSSTEPDGADVFQRACSMCHGAEAEGDIGPSLQGIGEMHSLEEITDTVTNGREGTIMPSWGGVLASGEIDAVASFVHSLEGEHQHNHDEGHEDGDGHAHGGDDQTHDEGHVHDEGHAHGDGHDHEDGGHHDHGDDDHDPEDGDDHDHGDGAEDPAPAVSAEPGMTG